MGNIINIDGRNYKLEDYRVSRNKENKDGLVDKIWICDIETGISYLVKASTSLSLEPFSEVLAYNIGLALGFNVLEHQLLPIQYFREVFKGHFYCKYVSICPTLNVGTQKLITLNDMWKKYNEPYNYNKYTREQVMEKVMPKEVIDIMLFFDAIIGNRDRHSKNIHMLMDIRTNEIVGYPILDNGDSFMSQELLGTVGIMGTCLGKFSNKSVTVGKNHDEQMKYITTIDTSMYNISECTSLALQSIEPILNKMRNGSKTAISKYLKYRINKYYSMFGAK